MTAATRYRGGNGFVAQWIYSGGTVTLSGDYTTFDVSRSIDLIDVTAGNDQDKNFIAGIKDGDASLTFYDTTGTGGSALLAALAEGTAGTLLYAPLGTATGKPKRGFPAISKGCKEKYPYDKAVEISTDFQKSGAILFDYNAVW